MAKKKHGGGAAASTAPDSPSSAAGTSGQIEAIVARIRSGRCILCAGSRISADPGLTYRDLVARLLKTVPGVDEKDAERVIAERPLAAAGFVRRRLGEGFSQALVDATRSAGTASEPLKLLAELPFRAVVTTSYDDSVEKVFTREGQAPRIYTPRDAEALRKDGKARFILKALGDPSRAETIVWSAEDLQSALADGGYRAVTHDLYRSRSFLFVGFDSRDPDLGILLERVLSGASAGDTEHFAVLPGLTEIEREELYAAYHIRVLDVADIAELARQLRAAIGDDPGHALPDEEDVEGWISLLEEDPNRADARDHLDKLERTFGERSDHEALVELYLGRVGVEPAAAQRAAMLRQVGALFETQLGDLGKAFTALLAAYKESPEEQTWNDLERLASATGTWNELLAELAEIVPTLPATDRADAWVRIARLYGEKLGHHEYAITSLDEALKLSPDRTDAQELRIAELRKSERWKDLADALWRLAAQQDDLVKKGALLFEQGDIYETHLSDGAKAAQCYEEALGADPTHQEASGALETLLRRRGDFAELVLVLDRRAPHSGAEEALALRREAAELVADKLSNRRDAIARFEAIVADHPRDMVSLRALERLYEHDGNWEQYLRILGLQAEVVESDKERAALYRRIASEWEEHPGGAPRAAEYLERLLALDSKSEDAFRSLERLYRTDRNWDGLVDVLRRHAAIVPTAIRGDLFSQIGAIYETELKDPARAIEAYTQVDEAVPNHAEALAALSRLYEKTEAWESAVAILDRRGAQAENRAQRVELFHRAGEIAAQRLGDSASAETRFVRALEIEATHVPSMTALVEIYRKNGEFLKAAKLLVEAVPHTQNRLEKTRLLVEAGEIYDGLEDARRATELYTEALSVDPEHVEAAERLSELLWKAERHQELVPILEMLTRKEADPHVQIERLVRLGRAARTLGAFDKVAKALTRAAELDPTHLEAQRGRGEILYSKEEWAEAQKAYAEIRKHHMDDLPPSERVEVLHRLGTCALRQGDKESARGFIQAALDLDPTHRPTLLLQVELGEAKPESVIDAKKALLVTASTEERIKLLTEIGELYLSELEDPPQAIGAYREALELRPDNQRLLHKCLDIYVEQKSWVQALEMLDRLIAAEKDPLVRAKYRHAAGLLCRDELGQIERATRLLQEALDDDPSHDRAALAIEEMLRDRQEWKELARYYRKALKRLGPQSPDGKDDERLRMWSTLADVALERLGERDTALAAYEIALTFDRTNLDRHTQLAELYVQAGPEYFDKAIVEHQVLLRADKQRIASYKLLKQLYLHTRQSDKAAAISYALSFLKKGEADDQKVVAELKARPPGIARRTLSDEMWARLMHPDEDRYISALMGLLAPLFAPSHSQAHKQAGLNRKEALEPNDSRFVARTLRHLAGNLGVQVPEAYTRPDQKEPVQVVSCIDKATIVPVLLLGAPLLSDKRPEREVMFELARRLTNLRNDRYLKQVLPQPAQLAHLLDIAINMSAEADGAGTAQGELGKTIQGIRKVLTPAQIEQIHTIGRYLKTSPTRPLDAVAQWVQATDLTANRAAFVLAGDLETCARQIAADPPSTATLAPTQRLLDLIWSSVTEDIFAVRKYLGLA